MDMDYLLNRIVELEKDMDYWKEAHLRLQNQLIDFERERLK